MRVLITGVGGFVGHHLVDHLLAAGDHIVGLGRGPRPPSLAEGVDYFSADLRDTPAVARVVGPAQPDVVYHLAAQSSTGDSLIDPWATLSNNLHGQIILLESLVSLGTRPRVLIVGSGDEYGNVRAEDLPTHERVPLLPASPYAVSKAAQDMLGYQYFAQGKLDVIRVRPFSHTGPGHDARFVIPSFAKQLAEMEAAIREPVMYVGNLDVQRDFTDVRDVVRAYRLAALRGEPGQVYNIGTGRSVALDSTLEMLIHLSSVRPTVEVAPALIRPIDVPRQQADSSLIRNRTGWVPEIPWEDTLSDTLEYWRERVRGYAMRP